MCDIDYIKCSCGFNPKRVKATKREFDLHNCGRDYECCIQVWKCPNCTTRWVLSLEAPERR